MLTVTQIDTRSRRDVRRFVDLPYRLYQNDPQWVPPLRSDMCAALDRRKHPFYEHSDADFFVAARNGDLVGRVAVLENRRFNSHHGCRRADFYYFECEDDEETAGAVFDTVFKWARSRGLDRVVGPKGLSPFDGYGLVVDGFERRGLTCIQIARRPGEKERGGLSDRSESLFRSHHLQRCPAFEVPGIPSDDEGARRRETFGRLDDECITERTTRGDSPDDFSNRQ